MFRNDFLGDLSPVVETLGSEDERSKSHGNRVRFEGGREFRRVLGVPQNQWWYSTQAAVLAFGSGVLRGALRNLGVDALVSAEAAAAPAAANFRIEIPRGEARTPLAAAAAAAVAAASPS